MSWDQLDMSKAHEVSASGEAQLRLQRCVKAALAGDTGAPLRQYLERLARGDGYVPGRSHADTAYYDGIRALAARLLYLGEKRDEQ